jgi:hypothetical protein
MDYKQADIEARWKQQNDLIHDQHNEVILSRRRPDLPPSERHQKALRAYWKTASQIMTDYISYTAFSDRRLEPFPLATFAHFVQISEDFGLSIVPQSVEQTRKLGQSFTRADRRHIAKAIFFMEAVAAKNIKCSNPTTTVANHFDVTTQTVRTWKKDRERFCEGIERPHPNVIEEAMVHAGKRYSGIVKPSKPEPQS